MNHFRLLLTPRIRSFQNRLKSGEDGSLTRLLILGLMAGGFWAGIFYGFLRVLAYFHSAEDFGAILAQKLMGMVWLTFFAVLLFSNVITALSTFFLSKDLETIHAAPVSLETLFWARLTDTLVDSSWMVFFFGLPVFLAYGVVFDAGLIYYLALAATSAPFLVLATSLGVIFTLVLVNVFPARRAKDILFLLSIMLVIILYLLFRFMRPERLVNPDAFSSALNYFASLNAPSSYYLPSQWASEVLWPLLHPGTYNESLFYLGLLWSTAAAAAVMASWIAAGLYKNGFTRSQEGARRVISKTNPIEVLVWLVQRPFPPASRVLIAKEIKSFFRDNTQWTQLLLLLALIVIYLYNFSVLDLRRAPVRTFYLQNLISFLNVGLAAFVVASLGVRFTFPSVSQEGFSYWIIRSSPLSLNRFLWTKYFIYAPPLVVVAEILIVLSNHILNVTPFMMTISTITMFFLVLGLVGMGVGLGAVYPRFESENMAAVATGFGGMIYMILSALYVAVVIVLEAWPVYMIFMSQARDWPLGIPERAAILLCFIGVILANGLAVFVPMRLGRKHLLAREST